MQGESERPHVCFPLWVADRDLEITRPPSPAEGDGSAHCHRGGPAAAEAECPGPKSEGPGQQSAVLAQAKEMEKQLNLVKRASKCANSSRVWKRLRCVCVYVYEYVHMFVYV